VTCTPLGWCTAATLAKKAHAHALAAETGSRNMMATRCSDSATPTSYSTSYTLWGLSCTVTALPGKNFNISPL